MTRILAAAALLAALTATAFWLALTADFYPEGEA